MKTCKKSACTKPFACNSQANKQPELSRSWGWPQQKMLDIYLYIFYKLMCKGDEHPNSPSGEQAREKKTAGPKNQGFGRPSISLLISFRASSLELCPSSPRARPKICNSSGFSFLRRLRKVASAPGTRCCCIPGPVARCPASMVAGLQTSVAPPSGICGSRLRGLDFQYSEQTRSTSLASMACSNHPRDEKLKTGSSRKTIAKKMKNLRVNERG